MVRIDRFAATAAALFAGTLLTACTSTTDGSPAGSAAVSSPPTGNASSSSTAPTSAAPPTPDASTVTRTVTQAPPSAESLGSTADVPAGFVAEWDGHGRKLTVHTDGSVALDFRLYVNCTAQRTTGCDRMNGNEIIDGGQVSGHVSQVINANTVTITVSTTTVPSYTGAGTLRLGHDLTHHAVAIFGGKFNGLPFCSADSPSGYCGA